LRFAQKVKLMSFGSGVVIPAGFLAITDDQL
jgi:hypothetical protein